MAININHQADKIKSESDLILDAGASSNIDVSAKIVKNASDPVDAQDLVTKVFLETAISNVDAGGDADTASVLEIIENIRINAYVKSVDFVSDIVTGGAGLTATLTISTVGDPNRYTIDWGDGNTTTATTDSTPTHTYATNTGSPFDVNVTAFNNTGTGAGSSAQKLREDYITIFTGDPAVSFVVYDAPTGGNAITYWDDGDTVYFENTATNTSNATVQYTWTWGDGTSNDYFPPEVPALPSFKLHKFVSDIVIEKNSDYRTGVIFTTNRRVWEHDKPFLKRLKKTTAIGVDMETATVFSVGHFNEIARGALLLVSDVPLTPEGVKTETSDKQVTQKWVDLHLEIGIKAMTDIGQSGEEIKHFKY